MEPVTVEKIQDLAYDELLTLGVIEQNADLTEVFRTEINMPFNLLYKIQKEGKLNEATKKLLTMIFEKIILTKQSFINQYMKLGNIDIPIQDVVYEEPLKLDDAVLPIQDVPTTPIGLEATVVINEEIVKPTPTVKEVKAVKAKPIAEKKLPRRFGKREIEKLIINQGFKATPLQRAGLKLNDLKNINVVLMNKFIKEIHLGTEELTEEDSLEIIASITQFEKRVAKILKKK